MTNYTAADEINVRLNTAAVCRLMIVYCHRNSACQSLCPCPVILVNETYCLSTARHSTDNTQWFLDVFSFRFALIFVYLYFCTLSQQFCLFNVVRLPF